MRDTTTIHQHYVWRGYLRAWAYNDKLYCLRNRKELFPVNIIKIAQENLFYEFKECTDEEISIGYHFAKNSDVSLMEIYDYINNEIRSKSITSNEMEKEKLLTFVKDFEEKYLNFPIEERLKSFLYSL